MRFVHSYFGVAVLACFSGCDCSQLAENRLAAPVAKGTAAQPPQKATLEQEPSAPAKRPELQPEIIRGLEQEGDILQEANLLLQAFAAQSCSQLQLACKELDIEIKRVNALKQYVEFEFGSQRTEEQDILFRLSQLLGGDLGQLEREISRLKESAARSPGSVAAETLERKNESALMLRTQLSTLEREELFR